MIHCPCCNGEDIQILDEDCFCSIHGHAEACGVASCETCGCIFEVRAEGDFVTCDGDYHYDVIEEGRD